MRASALPEGDSENAEKAVEYLGLAGHQAVHRSANEEAIQYLTQALNMLYTLPETPERAQQELPLQLALGSPLLASKGYGAPDVERVFSRARELCQQTGDTTQLFPILRYLWYVTAAHTDHQVAQELAEQMMDMAKAAADPASLMEAHYALWCQSFVAGELAPARDHLERLVRLYNRQDHHALASLYGQDPGVTSQAQLSVTLWILGFPEQARQTAHQALALAHELSHPFSLAFAMSGIVWSQQLRREVHAAEEQAAAAIALSTEHDFPAWLSMPTMVHGWALAELGQTERGIRQIRDGLAAWEATGAIWWRSQWLVFLAQAYEKSGQAEAGLTVVAEALAFVEETKERFCEAELYRLKGELLLQESLENHPEAMACFQTSIDIARHQHAKSWELRAATSLARLWQSQGKITEARDLLAPVYEWFTEGFDTADLKDAKALLAELSEGH